MNKWIQKILIIIIAITSLGWFFKAASETKILKLSIVEENVKIHSTILRKMNKPKGIKELRHIDTDQGLLVIPENIYNHFAVYVSKINNTSFLMTFIVLELKSGEVLKCISSIKDGDKVYDMRFDRLAIPTENPEVVVEGDSYWIHKHLYCLGMDHALVE